MVACSCSKVWKFFLSFLGFPSCMFWITILLPVVRYSTLASFILINSKSKFIEIPCERSLFNNKHTCKSMRRFEIVYIVAISIVLFHMRKKFIKAMNHSAPIATIKFKKYTDRFVIPALIYILSLICKLVTAKYENPIPYCVCMLIYLLSIAVCFYLYNIMFMIKECSIYPIGHYIDYLLIIDGTTYLPFLFLSFYYNNLLLNQIYSITEVIFMLLLVFKYSFISMHVLGKKFLRCSELYV